MRSFVGLVGFILLWGNALGDSTYRCIPDAATGFYFDESTKSWKPTNFNVEEKKYVLKEEKASDEASAWILTELAETGERSVLVSCIDTQPDATLVICDGGVNDFRFNKQSLRYMLFYPIGYVQPEEYIALSEEGSDTPHIEIGKCAPI